VRVDCARRRRVRVPGSPRHDPQRHPRHDHQCDVRVPERVDGSIGTRSIDDWILQA
jgi:hypothetical protein